MSSDWSWSNRVNLKTAVGLLCEINPVIIREGRTTLRCSKGTKLGIVTRPTPILSLEGHRGNAQLQRRRNHLRDENFSNCAGGLTGNTTGGCDQTKANQSQQTVCC